MTREQHLSPSGGDRSVAEANPRVYADVRNAIADDLASLKTDQTIGVARLVSDLFEKIESVRETGQTFDAIAKIFERRGVPATSDALRIALGRERKRRIADQPTPKKGKKRRRDASFDPHGSVRRGRRRHPDGDVRSRSRADPRHAVGSASGQRRSPPRLRRGSPVHLHHRIIPCRNLLSRRS